MFLHSCLQKRGRRCLQIFTIRKTKLREGNGFIPVCDSDHGVESLSRGVSVQEVFVQGLCPGRLSPGPYGKERVVRILLFSFCSTFNC